MADNKIDDPEFQEFISLQRNLGQNTKSKHIWADDVKLGVDTHVPKVDSKIDDDSNQQKHKRHHRSRPKKKNNKSKPKELFEHTLKLSGFPATARRKDVIDFFKPLGLISVRLNKRDGIVYVSFKDNSDLNFALKKNNHFWTYYRISMARHNIKRSRLHKEAKEDKRKEKEVVIKKQEERVAKTEPVDESGRIFVRNLNYKCTQHELEELFSKYGEITEVHMPIDFKTSQHKGYAYVEFMFPENARKAFDELNGTMFQDRKFHLIPSEPKPRETTAVKPTNWNILFLGQNALADVVSDSRGVEKSKLLTQPTHKDPIAVRMALGDASVVEDTRNFLISNGIELDSFNNPRAPRSKTVILVKNLPKSAPREEIDNLFKGFGRVERIIMPPNGLTAIVEMEEPNAAQHAFKKLAYSKFRDNVLYLEWAPINVFREKSMEDQDQAEMKQLAEVQTGTKILVKNVPFEATQDELKKVFAAYGELNFVRLPKKVDGSHRGFGFVSYLTSADALRAFRGLGHSTHLYGRKLVLEWAKKDE